MKRALILVDVSKSICDNIELKEYLYNYFRKIKNQIEYMNISCDSNTYKIYAAPLQTPRCNAWDRNTCIEKIFEICNEGGYRGGSPIWTSIMQWIENLGEENQNSVIIVLSDLMTNNEPHNLDPNNVVENLRAYNIKFILVKPASTTRGDDSSFSCRVLAALAGIEWMPQDPNACRERGALDCCSNILIMRGLIERIAVVYEYMISDISSIIKEFICS